MAKAKTVQLISVEARVYPTLGLVCDAGEIIELDSDPGIHGLWPLDKDGHAIIPGPAPREDQDGGDTGTEDDDQGNGDADAGTGNPDGSTSSPDTAGGESNGEQNPGEGA